MYITTSEGKYTILQTQRCDSSTMRALAVLSVDAAMCSSTAVFRLHDPSC